MKDAIERIRKVAEALDQDDPDKLEMLNIEGDYTALMEWALRKRLEAKAHAEAIKSIEETYRARRTMFDGKAENMRSVIEWSMKSANEHKNIGPSGTVSFGKKKQGVTVIDESKIPDEFFKIERKLDKAKLNEACLGGANIEGAVLDNGGETLIIRSK